MHALVCRLRHKTDGGRTAQDTHQDLMACFGWKQVIRSWVSQSGLKTGIGVTAGVHVTPSQKLCRNQVEDRRVDATGCVRPCYPYFAIFYVLGPRGIVVF
jgi:hypothetical protein